MTTEHLHGIDSGTQRAGWRRRASSLWWVGAAALPAVAIGIVVSATGRDLNFDGWPAYARADLLARMILVEAAMITIGAPLAGVVAVARDRGRHASRRQPSGLAGTSSRVWPVVLPPIAGATVLAGTSVVMALAIGAPGSSTLWISHVVLWAAALALAAMGTLSAAALREPLDAAALALVVSAMTSAGLLVSGPLLGGVSSAMLNGALLANPIIVTAASANIDLLRMDPFYRLSPLAQMVVDYPAPSVAFAYHAVAALIFFVGTALRIDRRARVCSAERISA